MKIHHPPTLASSSPIAAPSYYIRAEYFYYRGTFYAPTNGALRDLDGERLEFGTRAEAKEYLTKEQSEDEPDAMGCTENAAGDFSFDGDYICRHGEYARPRYAIRKVPTRL